jgi:hypothetical protein
MGVDFAKVAKNAATYRQNHGNYQRAQNTWQIGNDINDIILIVL